MNTLEKLQDLAEQAKSLYPADAMHNSGVTRVQLIDEDLDKAVSQYNTYIESGDTWAANNSCVTRFRDLMNTKARIAHRQGFQSEIVEIK